MRGFFPSLRVFLFGPPAPKCGYAHQFEKVSFETFHCYYCSSQHTSCHGVRYPTEFRVRTCVARPDPRCMGSLCAYHCSMVCPDKCLGEGTLAKVLQLHGKEK